MRETVVFCTILFGANCGASATELGLASFYDGADGLTAAHRSLPLGSRVKVLNLDNGRAVVVKIVDRGPFIRGRVIDVSTAVAVTLGFRGAGLARVKIDPVSYETPEAAPRPERQAAPAPMASAAAEICRYGGGCMIQSDRFGGEAAAARSEMECENLRSRPFGVALTSPDLAPFASPLRASLSELEAAASIPASAIAEVDAAASIPVIALPPVPER